MYLECNFWPKKNLTPEPLKLTKFRRRTKIVERTVVSFLNQFLDSKFFNDPTPGHESIRLILLIIVIYGGILIGLIASCIYMRDTKQGSTLSKEQRAEMELHRKKSVQFQTEFEFEKRKTTKKVGVRQRSKSEFEVSQSSFGDCIVDTGACWKYHRLFLKIFKIRFFVYFKNYFGKMLKFTVCS